MPSEVPDDRLRYRPRRLPPLAALLRGADRHVGARCPGGWRARPGLSAEAQFLRFGRRYRAGGCAQPDPVRASRGARCGDHQRPGASVLVGRQHLHAGPGEPRAEGQFLQVHQRDQERHRGFERACRLEVYCGGQRRLRRRRLRAGACLRRDRHDRRPVEHIEPTRGAAPRRAARHWRADAAGRQAQGQARSRRRVLHHCRGGARRPRDGLGPRRLDGAAGALQTARPGAGPRAGGRQRPSRRRRRCDAAAARPAARCGRLSLPLGRRWDRARRANRDGDGRGAALRGRAR